MSTRNETKCHSQDFLNDCGWVRDGIRAMFKKKENDRHRFLLSPSVAENKSRTYWFDTRLANLNRINESKDDRPRLLIRIVSDLFFGADMQTIQPLLTEKLKRYGKHSGDVWRNYIEMPKHKVAGKNATLYSGSDKSVRIPGVLMDKPQTAEWLKNK